VWTVLGDADGGVPDGAPYDRIVVTVRADDIPPAWVTQLGMAGRMVVPLQLRGLTRSIVLDRAEGTGGRLRGGNARLCSFVPMQGAGARDETVVAIKHPGGAQVRLRTEAASGPELSSLAAAVGTAGGEPVTVWTGVEFDHVDDLDLWLGLHLPRFGVLHADRELPGVYGSTSVTRSGAPTLLDESGFAYRTKRPMGAERFETGVLAWGPDAAALAQLYADTVAAWGRYRAAGGTGPDVEVALNPNDLTPRPGEVVVDKHHVRIVVSWPTSS
jgi:protein-L-isoaspartate(D-aspartate) O-methyltransferase